MKAQARKYFGRQAGMTLMEVIASLAVMAIVVVGALALYGSASSSQQSTQLAQDLTAIRAGVKQVWSGQGTYGTANVNDTLVTAKRIPTTMTIDTATTPDTITHPLNGTIDIAGATSNFTVTATAIPSDVCTSLMTAGQGWISIKAGAAAARTPPVAPATAAADCGAAATVAMIFTGN